jgi:uncharacterized membrane protein YgdD (TMEM256/DUF423 family)
MPRRPVVAVPGSLLTIQLSRLLIAVAAVLMAVGVGLGAYGSHGLGGLDAGSLRAYETGVQYQLVHSLALIALAIYGERHPANRTLALAALLLLTGMVLFCGGVYSSSLDGPGWIARLAPTGGIGLMAGWIVLAVAAAQQLGGHRR